jgi:hypothetical protein
MALVLFIVFVFSLTGCAPFKFSDKRAGICNELNSEMIFNANTSDTRIAEIQSAEQPLMQRAYRKNHCDY